MNKSYIIAIVVVLVILGVAGYAFFLMQGGGNVYNIELREFAFVLKDGSFPLHVKAGEKITFKIKNVGGVGHEFMIVTDKDAVIDMIHQKIAELQAKYGNDTDKIETEYESWHESIMMQRKDLFLAMKDLEPGESATVTYTFQSPGTYWIVCAEVGGTLPKIHADFGMIAEIDVS